MDEHSNLSKIFDAVLDVQCFSIFSERASSHGVQSLSRPEVVPVHGATVDNGRELSATLSEFLTDGGEGQHNVEALSALSNKVVELSVSAVTLSSFTSTGFDVFTDSSLLISREQVRDFSRVKKIVNIFQETFLHDLSIREEELYEFLVDTALAEEIFNVLMELLFSVGLSNFDRHGLDIVNSSSKSSHRLSSRTTESNKQCITSLLSKSTRDSSQMLDTVFEENNIHRRVVRVIQA
jgi:6-pyruvoyl-tetrahydropterin synthase